jgi:hypothetical protein
MTNRPGKRYPIGISLPWPIADALDAFCKRTNTKRSEVIDEALRTFLQIETRAEQIRRLGQINSVIPCYRGDKCSWPACAQDCDGRPGAPAKEGQDENADDIFGGAGDGSAAG